MSVGEGMIRHIPENLLVDYCLIVSPGWVHVFLLGFQHFLVVLWTSVIIAAAIVPHMGGGIAERALVIQTLLFVSGLNTLLQTFFGTRLSTVIGGSFRFIIPSLYIAFARRYVDYVDPKQKFIETMRAIQGALLIASALPILLGFLGIWRIVARFLSPLSAVPLVTLVGLGLYEYAFPLAAECVEIGLPEIIILYAPEIRRLNLPDFLRYAVLLSVALVWAFASLLTVTGVYKNKSVKTQLSCRVDRSGLISASEWFRFPYPFQWGRPEVHAGEVLVTLAAVFVTMIESSGAFIAAFRYAGGEPLPPSVLGRGIGWLGIGFFLDGMFGTGVGSTAAVENVGLLGITRVGSRRVVQISAAYMLFFSLIGKFAAVFASIPLPIIGAVYCILFAVVSFAGIGMSQYCDLNSWRTNFVVGFSFFMGLSVPRYFADYAILSGHGPVDTHSQWFNGVAMVIFSSPAAVAAVVAVFLDVTTGRSGGEDGGRKWWSKYERFDGSGETNAKFYALPWGLSKYFPSH
ncbi:root uracil permease 1 [Genlisea aurea]|uniref:Root uracil permease 1 n=1 Tax=Genlisea aurea TaxID=192259 RepID=S8CNK9_9LAMI|nr:root uracil permease 1 [Genlisea aurea]